MQGVSASANTNSPTGAGIIRRAHREGRSGLVLEGSVAVSGPEVPCKALPAEGTACAKHRHVANHSNLTEFSQLSGDDDFLLLWGWGSCVVGIKVFLHPCACLFAFLCLSFPFPRSPCS